MTEAGSTEELERNILDRAQVFASALASGDRKVSANALAYLGEAAALAYLGGDKAGGGTLRNEPNPGEAGGIAWIGEADDRLAEAARRYAEAQQQEWTAAAGGAPYDHGTLFGARVSALRGLAAAAIEANEDIAGDGGGNAPGADAAGIVGGLLDAREALGEDVSGARAAAADLFGHDVPEETIALIEAFADLAGSGDPPGSGLLAMAAHNYAEAQHREWEAVLGGEPHRGLSAERAVAMFDLISVSLAEYAAGGIERSGDGGGGPEGERAAPPAEAGAADEDDEYLAAAARGYAEAQHREWTAAASHAPRVIEALSVARIDALAGLAVAALEANRELAGATARDGPGSAGGGEGAGGGAAAGLAALGEAAAAGRATVPGLLEAAAHNYGRAQRLEWEAVIAGEPYRAVSAVRGLAMSDLISAALAAYVAAASDPGGDGGWATGAAR